VFSYMLSKCGINDNNRFFNVVGIIVEMCCICCSFIIIIYILIVLVKIVIIRLLKFDD
jgi:hypothetical protein